MSGSAAPILVIKHGALGDFIMAMGPAKAIRRHHSEAEIILLTTGRYYDLAHASGYFDRIWIDNRPGMSKIGTLWRLRQQLGSVRFARVYDLQTSHRTALYFHLWPRPRPQWSGHAFGASHRHSGPERKRLHTIERQRQQLRIAGIEAVDLSDLSWMRAPIAEFHLPQRFALLIPSAAEHRPDKRWPAVAYGQLAAKFHTAGIASVVLGAADARAAAETIKDHCPSAIDLTGRTTLPQLAEIARHGQLAIGNDTGPMHIVTMTGCASVVLFSAASDPKRTAPRGPKVNVLREERLETLSVERVWHSCETLQQLAN